MKLPLTFITKVLFNFAYAQFGAAFQKVIYGKYLKAVHYANIRGFKMNYEFYGKV